VNLPV